MTIALDGSNSLIDGYATHIRGLRSTSKDDGYQLRDFHLVIQQNGAVELTTVGPCSYLR